MTSRIIAAVNEGDDREEARVAWVADHVARGVDVHDGADAGHEQQEHDGQLIDVEAEVDGQRPDLDEAVQIDRLRTGAQDLDEGRDREQERERDGGDANAVAGLAEAAAGHRQQQARQQGQQGNQGQDRHGLTRLNGANRDQQEADDAIAEEAERDDAVQSTPTQTRSGSGIGRAAAVGGAATACPPNTRTMSKAR